MAIVMLTNIVTRLRDVADAVRRPSDKLSYLRDAITGSLHRGVCCVCHEEVHANYVTFKYCRHGACVKCSEALDEHQHYGCPCCRFPRCSQFPGGLTQDDWVHWFYSPKDRRFRCFLDDFFASFDEDQEDEAECNAYMMLQACLKAGKTKILMDMLEYCLTEAPRIPKNKTWLADTCFDEIQESGQCVAAATYVYEQGGAIFPFPAQVRKGLQFALKKRDEALFQTILKNPKVRFEKQEVFTTKFLTDILERAVGADFMPAVRATLDCMAKHDIQVQIHSVVDAACEKDSHECLRCLLRHCHMNGERAFSLFLKALELQHWGCAKALWRDAVRSH